MDLATLFVRFKADTTDVNSKVKQLESTTKKSGDNIAKTLASAFSAAVIGAAIKKSIDAASDLNETVSKTDVIFGDASKTIQKQGDIAAKSMGLSKTAYLDAASGLKGLLDNLGLTSEASTKWSQDLVGLGSDLGSFFNKDPADAITAIQAALRGESEPIRAFNVNISDAALKTKALELGLYDGVGALDANARANAALALIMEQTTAAQGDFARTSDGAANSQRIAKAEAENAAASFGQVLLPVYTKVVQVVGDLAKVFGDLPGPVQTVIIALVGLVAIAGPIGSLIEVVGGIKTALAGLSASTGGLLLVAAAVAGLAFVLSSSDDPHAQVAERSKEVAANLIKETEAIAKQRQEAGKGATVTQGYADAQLALSNAITGSDENGQKLAKGLGALGLQTKDAAKFAALLQVASGDMAQSQEDAATAATNGAGAAHLAAINQRDLAVAMLESKGVAHDIALVLVEAGQGATYMGDAADVTKDKTKGWTDENKALLAAIIEVGNQAGNVDFNLTAQGTLNAAVATNKYTAGLVAQAEVQAGVSRNSAEATKVLSEYQTIVDNLTPSQQKLHEGIEQTSESWYKVAAATGVAKDATVDLAVAQDQAKARADANATATGKLKDALTKETSATDKARIAADEFGKALDEVFGSALDLEEANRALAEGFDKVAQSIKDNGNTLDISTEKGRNNRASIEDQVKAINKKIEADIASGVSIADATRAGEVYRQALINTSGSTDEARAAAEAYINQLGLTPENIATAVQLTHDEEVKGRLQTLLDKLGDIDQGAAAEIQADIDQGKFDEAEAELNKLARDRPVRFIPSGSFASGNVAGPRGSRSALGNFFRANSNTWTTITEPGAGDEVVLPLDNPGRMRQLAGSNDVGSRILDALLGSGASAGADGPSMTSSSITGGSSYSLTLQNYRSDITVDDLSQLLGRLRLQMS